MIPSFFRDHQHPEPQDLPLVRITRRYDRPSWSCILKRCLDVVIALTSIVILWPFFLLIAWAIKMTSPGPILYCQTRVGLEGKTFLLYKFRTMVHHADRMREGLLSINEASGPAFKIRNDPRMTPLGRYLRKYSLDELPQLWNILKEDMSLVGPRPPLPCEVLQYKPWQLRRLSVPQGLTGLWQVSGRSEVNFEDWMRLDLAYIDSWSPRRDLAIILKTFSIVWRGTGAY